MNFEYHALNNFVSLLSKIGLEEKYSDTSSFERFYIYGNNDMAIKASLDTRESVHNVLVMRAAGGKLPGEFDSNNTVLISFYIRELVEKRIFDNYRLNKGTGYLEDISKYIGLAPRYFRELDEQAFQNAIVSRDEEFNLRQQEFEERFKY